MNFICDNISVNGQGHLCFAGLDTVALAGEYGTPLYLFDEERIRHNCRVYTGAFAKYFPEGSMPVYASKAGCFKEMLRIVSDEGVELQPCPAARGRDDKGRGDPHRGTQGNPRGRRSPRCLTA